MKKIVRFRNDFIGFVFQTNLKLNKTYTPAGIKSVKIERKTRHRNVKRNAVFSTYIVVSA